MKSFTRQSLLAVAASTLLTCASTLPTLDALRPPIPGNSDLIKRGSITECNIWRSTDPHEDNGRLVDWMPIADSSPQQLGYESAVSLVCEDAASKPEIGFQQRASYTIGGQLDGGKHIMLSDGTFGVLTLWIDLAIFNEGFSLKPNAQKCKNALMKFADMMSPCYGSGRKDTIGGTFVDDDGVTYIARPEYAP
ncbi:hypothetical protein BDV96DRAFT_654899 [Lophiotrema nucula]|uniref:Uncharacterized protein n=1 Tax=Lophiotrema nucula TaxID=690887 RepID=A0A6A5YGL8_9PLEO|nr:hypothetical protein BDV96DRAFT_654899 [Lophiotrema nucula]